jgi:hypothetical protein
MGMLRTCLAGEKYEFLRAYSACVDIREQLQACRHEIVETEIGDLKTRLFLMG